MMAKLGRKAVKRPLRSSLERGSSYRDGLVGGKSLVTEGTVES